MQQNYFLLFPERHFEIRDLATACVLKHRGFNLIAITKNHMDSSIIHYVFKKCDGIEDACVFQKENFNLTTIEVLRGIAKGLVVRVKKN